MDRFDHTKPPKQELTTNGGVQIVVRDPEPEEERAPAPPSDPFPTAIVFPPGQNLADRAAFMEGIERQYGRFIDMKLNRPDVSPQSAEDLHQEAIIILFNQRHKLNGPPKQVTEFVATVVKHLICNRGRRAERALVRGIDLDTQTAAAPNPEDKAKQAELWRKLMGYVDDELSPEEREVWKARELDGTSLVDLAAALDRPIATIRGQHTRAERKLADRARASERAAALRAPGPQQSTDGQK